MTDVNDAVEEIFRILCQHYRQELPVSEKALRLLMNRWPPAVFDEAMRVIGFTGGAAN